MSLAIQAGIAGSLLIFFLLGVIILLDGVEKTMMLANDNNPDLFLFMLFIASLVGIMISVVTILGHYSQGATPLIDAATSVGIAIYYIAYFFSNNPFAEIEPDNMYQQAMVYSPHLGTALMFAISLFQHIQGKATLINSVSWEPDTIAVLTFVMIHLFLTLLVFGCFVVSEYLVDRGPHAVRKIRKNLGAK